MKKILVTIILFATIKILATPIGDSPQYFCEVDNPTVQDIFVENTDGFDTIYWFTTDDNSGTPLNGNTILQDNNTYYTFESLDSAAESLAVVVIIIEDVPAPIGEEIQSFCTDDSVVLGDLMVFNTADYINIYWYSDTYCAGGQLLSPNSPLEDGITYYAYQTFESACCPSVLAVTVNLANPISAPIGEEIQDFCIYDTPVLGDIIVENTDDYDSIYWFSNPVSDGSPLTLSTPLSDGDVFYAFQAISGTCINYLTVNVGFMTCLSVDDNLLSSFIFSPNPVKNNIKLNFDKKNDNTNISIYNAFGSIVYKNNFLLTDEIMIDLSTLNNGVYLINVNIDDSSTITKKFIKL